ncbi:MAG TPA: hypothetical protein VHF27_13175 [Acidimicrobiales bacterium]|nr:hypothetical protein [Acidimicrobiales bacterium]
MLKVVAAALLVLAAACGDGGTTDPLVDAHVALCQAAARPDQARQLFFDRSHDALHTVAADLEDVDRAQAAALLEAKQRVESGLDAPGPTLPQDMARLAEVYRASLGRLAIEAPPCEK